MLKKLKKSLASIKTKEVVDIIVFGSAVKGKLLPKDIDICVVLREDNIAIHTYVVTKIEEIAEKLKVETHISIVTVDNFFTSPHSLIRTILKEGISLITGKAVAEQYGLVSCTLYSYSLAGVDASKKVRFVYTVKGRKGEKGFVNKIGGEWIADSCFVVPVKKDYEIVELLKQWDIRFMRKPILLMN